MKKIALCIFLFGLLAAGCYKDLGNYAYHPINEVTIEGIETNYTVMFKDTLRIDPKLTFSADKADTGRYTYEWIFYYTNTLGDNNNTVVATTRNLKWSVNLKAGNYTAWLRVKDEASGVKYTKSFKVSIQTSVYEGWLVLSDVGGGAGRLDMVSRLPTGDFFIKDLLAFVGSDSSGPIKGPRGLKLMVAPSSSVTYAYVLTNEGTRKLHGEDFSWRSTYDLRYEMLGPAQQPLKAQVVTRTLQAIYFLMTDTELYSTIPATQGAGYGNVQNRLPGVGPIPVAPYLATPNTTVATQFILFDKQHNWFVRYDANRDASMDTIVTPPGSLFPYKIGKELVYMQTVNFNGGDAFAILKDPGGSKYYLARFIIDGYPSVFRQRQFIEIDQSTGDIAHATQFAVGHELGYICYSVGGKLYEYDLNYNKHFLMADISPEVVTKLKTQSLGTGNTLYRGYTNGLWVGSWNPGGDPAGSGKLRVYTMPQRNEPWTVFAEYGGFGKVIDMEYRTR
ncbi:PKD-like family lipoprotein [Chitinophaga lutea]